MVEGFAFEGTPRWPNWDIRNWISSTQRNNDRPARGCLQPAKVANNSYLVDPASSHMLVSKIKPCMSKYKRTLYSETADGSLKQF